jgi:DNA-binding LytR/AlgR family response regulator
VINFLWQSHFLLSYTKNYRMESDNKHITLINILGKNQIISIDDFLFVKANGKFTKGYFVEKDDVICSNLNMSFGKFVEHCSCYPALVQIHKSYVVNINKIDQYGNYPKDRLTITINDHKFELPIARKRKLMIHNIINRYKKSII